jgi:hypothetical protein
VAVPLIAPFGVIALSDYSVFEEGSVSKLAIERYVEDEDSKRIYPESHFADSDRCRSAFRTDVDHDSEVMPIIVPI